MKKTLLAFSFLLASLTSHGQDQGLGGLVNEGLAAMRDGNWEEALAKNSEAVERFGADPKNALQLHGPQFGVILFRKGISELKLKKFQEAMKSFESTYQDYPNDGDVAGGGNLFHKMALLKWGDAALGAEEYELAISKWKKFLEEREPRDRYPQGAFHVNMARANFKLDNLAEGSEHLEIAIKNKRVFPTPDRAIAAGFQTLVEAAIKAKNQKLVTDFVDKNGGELIMPPYVTQQFSKLFLKLGNDAIAEELYQIALTLYKLVPSTQVAIADLTARIAELGNLREIKDGATKLDKDSMSEDLITLKAELSGSQSNEMIKLAATAFILETLGDIRSANAAYLQLEKYYPKAEKREDNLFNLFRTASIIGDNTAVLKYGNLLRQDFPNTEVPSRRAEAFA